MGDTIVVACAADAKFRVPLVTLLYSALSHLDAETKLAVLAVDAGLSAGDRQRIERVCERTGRLADLTWLKPDWRRLSGLPATKGLPKEAFLRLLIPDLAPGVAKALWLDCDAVVERPLGGLWDHPFDDHLLIAVGEYGAETLAEAPGTDATYGELGLDGGMRYFNSGVMLMDLAGWRAHGIVDKVLEYTRRFHEKIRLADQDGLNAVLAGRWRGADLAWNVQVAALRYFERFPHVRVPPDVAGVRDRLYAEPGIVHYTTDKPWSSGLRSPFRRRYFHYLRESGFFNRLEYSAYEARAFARSGWRWARAKL